MGFIEDVAKYVVKYAPRYGIKVASPIIAQAILESASGTSNKVMLKDSLGNVIEWRHNYFGLKWRDKRCPISNDYFEEWTSEQNPDGTYKNIVSKFCKFKSLEDCVIGYFQWTNTSNYMNLKGVTDPETYLRNIKADKYATSHNYVDNLINVINRYNLRKYDSLISGNNIKKEERQISFNVHAGHNPDGRPACGACGFMNESTEARIVKDLLIAKLTLKGFKAYDCTCDDGANQSDVLNKIVSKCNEHTVDLDISIHFNAGAKDYIGNGQTTGTEVLVYSNSSSSNEAAKEICNSISKLGFKNRGVKTRPDLYFLKKTKAPACLIEVCFVDDKDDFMIYDANKVSNAICEALNNIYK